MTDPTPEVCRWTKEKPTKPGWYWHRMPFLNDAKHAVQVFLRDGKYHAILSVGIVPIGPSFEGSEWAGPISEPTEDKESK